MEKIYLDLLTPDRVVFSGYVKYVTLPEKGGEIMVLPGHAPLIGELDVGIIKLQTSHDIEKVYFCDGGFIDITWDGVTVLANVIKEPGDIDIEEVKKEKEEIWQKILSASLEYDYEKLMKEYRAFEYQIELKEKVGK